MSPKVSSNLAPESVDVANLTPEQIAEIRYASYLEYSLKLEREHPQFLAAAGMTAEEHARGMMEPGLSLEESVAAGWISEAERRFIEGRATLEDLLGLGYSSDRAQARLLYQEERACASST